MGRCDQRRYRGRDASEEGLRCAHAHAHGWACSWAHASRPGFELRSSMGMRADLAGGDGGMTWDLSRCRCGIDSPEMPAWRGSAARACNLSVT